VRVVGVGTCIEYAPSTSALREDLSPLGPISRYARCKVAVYEHLMALARAAGLPHAWARIFYPYGTGENSGRLCSALLARLKRNEPLALRTPRSVKDYLHVDDVAAALLALVEGRMAGACNVGSGEGIEIRELALRLARLLGRDELVTEAAQESVDTHPYVVADTGRLKSLGWSPTVSIDAGLGDLAAHFGA
jgi:dTDP-6-deoxy-L-talose 4-dehydrogenase (NAD+)